AKLLALRQDPVEAAVSAAISQATRLPLQVPGSPFWPRVPGRSASVVLLHIALRSIALTESSQTAGQHKILHDPPMQASLLLPLHAMFLPNSGPSLSDRTPRECLGFAVRRCPVRSVVARRHRSRGSLSKPDRPTWTYAF